MLYRHVYRKKKPQDILQVKNGLLLSVNCVTERAFTTPQNLIKCPQVGSAAQDKSTALCPLFDALLHFILWRVIRPLSVLLHFSLHKSISWFPTPTPTPQNKPNSSLPVYNSPSLSDHDESARLGASGRMRSQAPKWYMSAGKGLLTILSWVIPELFHSYRDIASHHELQGGTRNSNNSDNIMMSVMDTVPP